jgi:hypothetical protein
MLGLKIVWRINDIEYGYPSILTEELLDTKGLVLENTNFFRNLTQETLAKSNLIELLDYLRRIVLEVEYTDISYICELSDFAQKNYETTLVIVRKETKALWECLTSDSQVFKILHADEISSKDYFENDLIIIDNIDPGKINPYCLNFLSTDLNTHALYLKHNANEYSLEDDYTILSTIKPSEFNGSVLIEDYYINGLEMFEKHRELYTYKLKNNESVKNKIVTYKEKYNEEKIKFGREIYTGKFSKLIEVIKKHEAVCIIGEFNLPAVELLNPRIIIKNSISEDCTNILYDINKLSILSQFSLLWKVINTVFDIVLVK